MFEKTPDDEKNFSSSVTASNEKESSWKEFLKFGILAVLIVVPFRMYVAQPFIVSGSSMSPTFETGEYLIIDEISYRFNEPKRGDIIILKKPNNESEYLIKRIVGLPEETITINKGIISIKSPGVNGEIVLSEPYVVNSNPDISEYKVGAQEYFVMGDNRPVSLDSRYIGSIPRDHIIGHALLRLFPFTKINFLPGDYKSR